MKSRSKLHWSGILPVLLADALYAAGSWFNWEGPKANNSIYPAGVILLIGLGIGLMATSRENVASRFLAALGTALAAWLSLVAIGVVLGTLQRTFPRELGLGGLALILGIFIVLPAFIGGAALSMLVAKFSAHPKKLKV